ncbi:MAG: threonine synthase [Planctomycetia bacterium]|nr:threonine synthase [Planctomycetia bacterium]
MSCFVTHLESAIDGTRFEPMQILGMHADRPLWVRYDLPAIKRAITTTEIARREPSLWRYRELLPLPSEFEPVTLGEGMSPLLPCPRLGQAIGLKQLWIKDESQLPTGSFKSRGMTAAISMAKALGIRRVALPTAGNAGGAAAAYGARAGMEVFVFMPEDTPQVNQFEAALLGARVFLVNGLINDCGKIVKQGKEPMGWFDLSTLKEPYRLEGKKTMGLELAEQMDWKLPASIFYPTGGGTGLIGMWKAFDELKQLGWLRSEQLPRLYSCQSEGCSPIATAFAKGERFAEPFPNAHTAASGLRVPVAVGDFMMLDAIRASGGQALTGTEDSIGHWMKQAGSLEGISLCPETAICLDVLHRLVKESLIDPSEHVVVFNTGAAQKYLEAVPLKLPKLNKDEAMDWNKM